MIGYKNICIFVGGAIIGAAVAGYVTKQKYEAILAEEIESVKSTFSKRREKKDEVEQLTGADFDGDQVGDGSNDPPTNMVYRTKKGPISDYSSKIPKDDEEKTGVEKNVEAETSNREGIYVITLEEYSTEKNHYGKETLSYYDDDVLLDEHEEIIPAPQDILGDDALLSFGEGSDDPDIVYVRNDDIAMDYEVIAIHTSYEKREFGEG